MLPARAVGPMQTPKRTALLLPLACMAGLFWLSSIPGEPSAQDPDFYVVVSWVPPAVQNLLHVPVFGVLAWLWCWSLPAWVRNARFTGLLAFLLTAGYGVVDELHQAWVPGRYATWTDVSLNVLGAAIGLWVYQHWPRARS